MWGIRSLVVPVMVLAAAAASGLASTICALTLTEPLWAVIAVSWGFLLILGALAVWAGHWSSIQHLSSGVGGGMVGAVFGAVDNLKRVMTAAERRRFLETFMHYQGVQAASAPSLLHFSPMLNYVVSVAVFAWVGAFVSSAAARYFVLPERKAGGE